MQVKMLTLKVTEESKFLNYLAKFEELQGELETAEKSNKGLGLAMNSRGLLNIVLHGIQIDTNYFISLKNEMKSWIIKRDKKKRALVWRTGLAKMRNSFENDETGGGKKSAGAKSSTTEKPKESGKPNKGKASKSKETTTKVVTKPKARVSLDTWGKLDDTAKAQLRSSGEYGGTLPKSCKELVTDEDDLKNVKFKNAPEGSIRKLTWPRSRAKRKAEEVINLGSKVKKLEHKPNDDGLDPKGSGDESVGSMYRDPFENEVL